MKKLFLMVATLGVLFTSCSYDDTAVINRIDDLENRVTELEETITALNQDIAGVQTLVNALQNNVYVSKIVEGESGYEIYFTNGDKIVIADGKDGEAGKDGVTVTVMLDETDGQYYWAITENGTTSFIEVDGMRLPVKGEKGNTPLMRVTMEGETGYWEVSYDNGETWERILLADGTPVTTSGGAGGLFKAAYIDEENNVAVFEFLNGETLEIELRSDLYINFKGEAIESADFSYGQTQEFEMEAVGVLKAIVNTPDEWNSSFNKETGVWSITAPSAEHAACADLEGEVALIYFGEENQSSVITLNVSIGEYVTVAEEYLTINAAAVEANYQVPFTADGEVTVEVVDAWITGTVADGIATITVAANEGIERTGTIKLIARSNEVVITVIQATETQLQAYGYREGSETTVFAKTLSEISGLNAAAADHIAVTNDYVIISAPNETPVVLDATTGEYVGTLNVGDLPVAAVTADDANNIVISTYQEATGFRVARMKDINDTPEVFIEHTSTEYGKDISVVGDVYGDARVTLMYSPWSSGTTGHLLFSVVGGVADVGYWSKIAAGDITDKIDNNNGDVIYRDMGEGAPYFMTGYSSNCFVWAEAGTALAVQITTNSNCGAVCIDVEKFNGAYYLMTACDTYFTWALTDAAIFLADVTSIDNFKAGVKSVSTGSYGWNAASTGGNTDCAMKVSEDGIYMYVYVLHPNATLGCIRVDCLAN
uniref:PL29 family lyase N-terminal domain-containing protein n=1 Tax=Alistipes sp. TaxID=1872444 RepID=UPI0040570D2E